MVNGILDRAAVKVVDGGGGDEGGRVELSGDEEGDDGGVGGRRGEVRFRVSLAACAERPSTTVSSEPCRLSPCGYLFT